MSPMPGDETLYAFTECGSPSSRIRPYDRYPAYLNVTRRAIDGCYVITVRSRDTCSAGQIVLTAAQFAAFKLDIGIAPLAE